MYVFLEAYEPDAEATQPIVALGTVSRKGEGLRDTATKGHGRD